MIFACVYLPFTKLIPTHQRKVLHERENICEHNSWSFLLPFTAYILDGVNLKGYFAYALSDQRDPGFGLYGQVHEEVIDKASLFNYRNIIQHNGFPVQGAAPQHCPSSQQPCLGCHLLVKWPVLGFLTLVGLGVIITLCLIIYYTAKRHKSECYWGVLTLGFFKFLLATHCWSAEILVIFYC